VGFGELDDDIEMPLQMALISKTMEPISIRSKVRIGKRNVRTHLEW
jgi:hypothetical protein